MIVTLEQVIDVTAESVAAFVVLMSFSAWAAAETSIRRARARDAARSVRGYAGGPVAARVAAERDARSALRFARYPSASGPYR